VCLVLVFDTTTGATAIPATYLDGVDTGVGYAAALASNGPATLGPVGVGSTSAGSSAFFDGTIRTVGVINAALTASEALFVSQLIMAECGLL
jgi:hypothetical protein